MQKETPIFFLLLLCGLTVFAQTPENSSQNKSEVERVEKAVYELNQAMVNRDETALKNLTTEALTYGHSSGNIENKQAFVDAVVHGDFNFISTDTENQTVYFSGDDTAVVRHIFLIEAINKGNPVSIRLGNMMVFKKQKNQWRLLARQAYKL